MLEPLKVKYINQDEIIEEFKNEHPEYSNKQLTVRIYEQSCEIRCGKKLLDCLMSNKGYIFKSIGRIFGYCRVSTMKQNIERQIRNIKQEYPEAMIVTDEYTGTKLNRPNWTKLYNSLKAEDTVVFDSVSRMSRNAEEGFQVYQELFDRGVKMIFLKEHYIDSDVYASKLKQADVTTGKDYLDEGLKVILMGLAKEQIRIAFEQAEQEVEALHQRTREGIETARLNGKQIGQPKGAKLTTKKSIKAKEIILKRSKDFNGDLSDVEVMKLTGVARHTYYKYKRELREGV